MFIKYRSRGLDDGLSNLGLEVVKHIVAEVECIRNNLFRRGRDPLTKSHILSVVLAARLPHKRTIPMFIKYRSRGLDDGLSNLTKLHMCTVGLLWYYGGRCCRLKRTVGFSVAVFLRRMGDPYVYKVQVPRSR
jgi:hypothetical protein